MSTQRVLLMLFVTVAVAWMVGYAAGKHSAERWWQADEAKKAETIRTMKDGLCVSGDCFGKPQAVCYEPKWTGTFLTLVPCPKEHK